MAKKTLEQLTKEIYEDYMKRMLGEMGTTLAQVVRK